MLTPCHEQEPAQPHTYVVQIREDGEANIWKCGRCGHITPWTVGDYAEAYAEGDRLQRRNHASRIGWRGTLGTEMADHHD